MAIVGGGNIIINEEDFGFNYRGAWSATETYTEGDLIYYGTPNVAYVATTAIAANIIPTTQNSGWARLATRGTDGTNGSDGIDGDFTVWLFAKSNTEPRRPDSTDASYPADAANFSSTVWTLGEIPSGTEPLWVSFIRVRHQTSDLVFGQVEQLSGTRGLKGDKGDPGDAGARGPVGPQGPDGATGARGPQGTPGATGSQGLQGPRGNPGPKGDTGDPGRDGSQGPRGIQGPDGAVGPAGPAGTPGAPGATGATGPAGPKGDSQRNVYGRFASGVTPTQPTGLGFNNGRITGTGTGSDGASWNDDIPPESGNFTELWAVPVEIDNQNNTLHVLDTPYPAQGARGPQGIPGTAAMQGAKGDTQRRIYLRKQGTAPLTPTNITFDGTNFTNLTSGSDSLLWAVAPPTGTGTLYAQNLLIDGQNNSVSTLGSPYEDGNIGETGGYRTTFFRRYPVGSLTITGPINVRYNYDTTSYVNLDTNWHTTVPSGTDPLWLVEAFVPAKDSDGIVNVSILGNPYTNQGSAGTDGAAGSPGPAGPAGATGATGPAGNTGPAGPTGGKGDSVRFIWQRFATPPTAAPTGIGFANGRLTNLGSWSITPNPIGTDTLYSQELEIIDESTVNTVGIPWRAQGERGERGEDGEPGAPSGVNTDITEARFRFVVDLPAAANRVAQSTRASRTDSWTRGYTDITSFTGGLTGLATQDSTGITITSAGVYSVVIQMDLDVKATGFNLNDALWGFTAHVEQSDGTLIDEYIVYTEVIAGSLNQDSVVTGYGSIPPASFPAGSKIVIRVFYQRLTTSGSDLTHDFNFKIVTPAADDDRIVIRKYTQAGNPSGVKGDSQRAIFIRSITTPTAPTGIGLNGTILTNLGSWNQNGAPSGTETVWVQWLEIDNDTNPPTVVTVGTPFSISGPAGAEGQRGPGGATGPAGPAGARGLSEVAVWARSASRPGVPGALVFNTDTTLSISTAGGLTWYRDPASASGNAQLWRATVDLDLSQSPPSKTWRGSPIRDGQGATGPQGPQGNPGSTGGAGPAGSTGSSIRPIWTTKGSATPAPATPAANSISINSSGVWTDLTASDGQVWHGNPPSIPGGFNLYQQEFLVDWSTNPPTLTPLGTPFQTSIRGIAGPQGDEGSGGRGVRIYYRRTQTTSPPGRPAITYNGSAWTEPNPEDWIVGSIPNTGGSYIWRVTVAYQEGVSGTTVSDPVRFNAINGASILEIYQRGATVPAAPTLTYDGTTVGGYGSWSHTIPATPSNQNLWAMTAVYTEGVSGIILDPVIYLKGLATATPVVPPSTEGVRLSYGLANQAQAIQGTLSTTDEVQLAVGATHEFTVNLGPTTALQQNFVLQVPSGYTITSITDTIEGEILDLWTNVGQRWFSGPLRRIRTAGRYTVTVRRDS